MKMIDVGQIRLFRLDLSVILIFFSFAIIFFFKGMQDLQTP